MRRREVVVLLSQAAAFLPLTARSQQANRLPTIGFLGPDKRSWSSWIAAFENGLRKLGWIQGRTVAIEYRWSQGRPERVAEFATEFVQQKVDVIVTYGGAVAILKRTTTSIPIVFAIAADALGSGIVTNLAHPGGNVTGFSNEQAEAAPKRLELLHEAVPKIRRLAVLFDTDYGATVLEKDAVQAAAGKLNLKSTPYGIRRKEDIAPIFEALKGESDGLYFAQNALIDANEEQLLESALNARLPTISSSRGWADFGCLMTYGPNSEYILRRAAKMVDEILRGARPGDIPVEQPNEFELVINLKTAKALGVMIPDKVLTIADELIE
jgi:putative tryptophan/tyrosine transport system substrate-binding protein